MLDNDNEKEMLEEEDDHHRDNSTVSVRQKRQAEFPGAPEQDNTKSVLIKLKYEWCHKQCFYFSGLMFASPRWRWLHPSGPATATVKSAPSSTTRSLNRPFIRRFARKFSKQLTNYLWLHDNTECPPPWDVTETVPVSRSTSGTGCSPMIQTMTVQASSWTGSSFHHVVSAGLSL